MASSRGVRFGVALDSPRQINCAHHETLTGISRDCLDQFSSCTYWARTRA